MAAQSRHPLDGLERDLMPLVDTLIARLVKIAEWTAAS